MGRRCSHIPQLTAGTSSKLPQAFGGGWALVDLHFSHWSSPLTSRNRSVTLGLVVVPRKEHKLLRVVSLWGSKPFSSEGQV